MTYELQPCGECPAHLVSGWRQHQSYTVKVWRNGRLIEARHYESLDAALHNARALIRMMNTHRKTEFTWTILGTELKLGPVVWQEDDVVTYITSN